MVRSSPNQLCVCIVYVLCHLFVQENQATMSHVVVQFSQTTFDGTIAYQASMWTQHEIPKSCKNQKKIVAIGSKSRPQAALCTTKIGNFSAHSSPHWVGKGVLFNKEIKLHDTVAYSSVLMGSSAPHLFAEPHKETHLFYQILISIPTLL